MSSPPRSRKRNPRGEGSRLREEIVRAALGLIDSGGAAAVTLRAVAREAGISAPSIYDHFADLDQIFDAVVVTCFGDLTAAVVGARDAEEDPVMRLEAGCRAYLKFAERFPQRYIVLFRLQRESETSDGPETAGATAFATLVDGIAECAGAGRSTSTDPFADAVALWSGLHGFASLQTARRRFPWPDRDDVTRRIIFGLARIVQPTADPTAPR